MVSRFQSRILIRLLEMGFPEQSAILACAERKNGVGPWALIPSFIQRMNWFISRTGSDRYFVISRLLEGVEKRFAPFLNVEFKDSSTGGRL